jgi:hypothetical protein
MESTSCGETEETGSEGSEKEDISTVVAHPGHVCQTPFSSYRSQLVELFVLLVEASTAAGGDSDGEDSSNFCEKVPVDLWKCMVSWVFEYAHNNIYHAMFYRILFAVLRQNNETCLRNIFKHCRLVTYLIEAFEPFEEAFEKEYDETNDISMGDKTSERSLCLSLKDRNALRGLLINSCNAIRLQVLSLPPTSYLRNYLHSHSTWNEFLPTLRDDTLLQQPPGLGRYIPTPENRPGPNYMAALLSSLQKPEGEGIDHGSNYAKFLGFDEEIEWPEDNIETKKKKKGKKKKKNKHRRHSKSSEGSGSDEETDESESDTDKRASIGTDGSASSGEEEVEVEVEMEMEMEGVEGRPENNMATTTNLDEMD